MSFQLTAIGDNTYLDMGDDAYQHKKRVVYTGPETEQHERLVRRPAARRAG